MIYKTNIYRYYYISRAVLSDNIRKQHVFCTQSALILLKWHNNFTQSHKNSIRKVHKKEVHSGDIMITYSEERLEPGL